MWSGPTTASLRNLIPLLSSMQQTLSVLRILNIEAHDEDDDSNPRLDPILSLKFPQLREIHLETFVCSDHLLARFLQNHTTLTSILMVDIEGSPTDWRHILRAFHDNHGLTYVVVRGRVYEDGGYNTVSVPYTGNVEEGVVFWSHMDIFMYWYVHRKNPWGGCLQECFGEMEKEKDSFFVSENI
jgi:hypothetical protein